jgi:hypothetical protein
MRQFVARCAKLATVLLIFAFLGVSGAAPAVRGAPTLAALLPTVYEIPVGFVLLQSGSHSLAEVARTFPDPADAARQLTAWGWQEHAYRTFDASGSTDPRPPVTLEVNLQRFSDHATAGAALLYFAYGQMSASGLAPVAMERLGDQSWGLSGPSQRGREAFVAVQLGDRVVTVAAVSPTDDPIAEAIAVASVAISKLDSPALGSAATAITVGTSAHVGATQLGTCSVFSFAADQWHGGYYRGDAEWYARPWVAVYGARSDYPEATLTFALDATPVGKPRLTVEGIDDEWSGKNQITVIVNNTRVYTGESPFAGWDGRGKGENAPWTPVTVVIPEGLLKPGLNRITFANLEPYDNYGSPPYILLSEAVLTT